MVSPIATKTGQLWANLGNFKTILYPYIEGEWRRRHLIRNAVGSIWAAIKKLHSADVPRPFTDGIPREIFSQGREAVKSFLRRIEKETFEEPIAVKTADFDPKSAQIFDIVQRTEKFALKLQQKPIDFVLCHADIDGWNLLADKQGALYLVDWDTLIFAPKERDLMFMGAGIWDSGRTSAEEAFLFYQGYGQTEINQEAIWYYRFERIIQDIADYCAHLFLSDENGDDREQSFEYLKSNFLPGGPIEKAV